jgi:hypothetical protein
MTVFCLKLQATIGAHIENIVTTLHYIKGDLEVSDWVAVHMFLRHAT